MPRDWKSAYAALHADGEASFPPAGLHYVLRLCRQVCRARNRPVNPSELLEEFRKQTRRDLGPMVGRVLMDWRLTTPGDLGKAVVLLGRYGCLNLEPTDTVENFTALDVSP